MKAKQWVMVFAITCGLFSGGCATTQSSHFSPGRESDLAAINAVEVGEFMCSDPAVGLSVRDTVIEMLLPAGIRIVESDGDAVITGTVTMRSGSISAGITAQIMLDGEVVAATSAKQRNFKHWSPSPNTQTLARKIGSDLRKMLQR